MSLEFRVIITKWRNSRAALHDTEDSVSVEAAFALSKFGDSRAVEPLKAFLKALLDETPDDLSDGDLYWVHHLLEKLEHKEKS